jgi:hypothetical protein
MLGENKMAKNEKNFMKVNKNGPPAAGAYFLGMIGAAVHFVSNADGFWPVIMALLKSLVWPAFLIHRIFDLLNI